MNKNDLVKRQKEVLNNIYEAFQENNVTAAMAPGEEVGSTDMLLVQHTELGKDIDEVLGAYYFLPAPEEIGSFQYFAATLTLAEEIPKSAQEKLAAAVAAINSLIYFGTFNLSPDGTVLSYRHVTVIPDETDERIMSLTVQGTMMNAISEVSIWADELDALQYGKISYEQFWGYCEEFLNAAAKTK